MKVETNCTHTAPTVTSRGRLFVDRMDNRTTEFVESCSECGIQLNIKLVDTTPRDDVFWCGNQLETGLNDQA